MPQTPNPFATRPLRALGACAAEGASAATRDKPVSCGTTSCAQGAALGLSVAPHDPRFSRVSLRCLLPRRLLAWALPALVLSLAACAGSSGANPAPLLSTEWRLVEMDGQALPERPAATLAFTEPGKVAGSGSCNRFFGSVTLSGQQIGFDQIGATKMACMGAAGQLEPRYFAALQQAQRYEIRDTNLLIHLKDQALPLRFVRTRP